MYIVENDFKDVEDNNYLYKKGKLYPYIQKEITEKRINELSTKNNKVGKILIKKCNINDLNENQVIEYSKIMNIDIKEILIQELEKNTDSNSDKNKKDKK